MSWCVAQLGILLETTRLPSPKSYSPIGWSNKNIPKISRNFRWFHPKKRPWFRCVFNMNGWISYCLGSCIPFLAPFPISDVSIKAILNPTWPVRGCSIANSYVKWLEGPIGTRSKVSRQAEKCFTSEQFQLLGPSSQEVAKLAATRYDFNQKSRLNQKKYGMKNWIYSWLMFKLVNSVG